MTDFPQYRKYKNNLSYFKIDNNEHFTEHKKNGTVWEKSEFKVKILPDRNYINDMLHNYEPYWEVISEEEYQTFLDTL